MKSILAASCAGVTGITLGIALHHKQTLNTPSPVFPTAQHAYYQQPQSPQQQFPVVPPRAALSASQTNPQLEKNIQALLEQQEMMKNQQSELNRDLNAIQFRLDTHSESFRPLSSEINTETFMPSNTPMGLSPLLPPRS